jgi:hypothetical protein
MRSHARLGVCGEVGRERKILLAFDRRQSVRQGLLDDPQRFDTFYRMRRISPRIQLLHLRTLALQIRWNAGTVQTFKMEVPFQGHYLWNVAHVACLIAE